jgi:hypothetical protein
LGVNFCPSRALGQARLLVSSSLTSGRSAPYAFGERVLRSLVGFGTARDLAKSEGEGPMELAKLLKHNARRSALTPRRQLRVVGAPMRTLRVLIRQLRILREPPVEIAHD